MPSLIKSDPGTHTIQVPNNTTEPEKKQNKHKKKKKKKNHSRQTTERRPPQHTTDTAERTKCRVRRRVTTRWVRLIVWLEERSKALKRVGDKGLPKNSHRNTQKTSKGQQEKEERKKQGRKEEMGKDTRGIKAVLGD